MITETGSNDEPAEITVSELLHSVHVEADDAYRLPLEEALQRRQRRETARLKRAEWAKTATLLPFAFTGLVNPSAWIGYVVLVQGLLCHMGAALGWRFARHACLYVVVCNVAFCIYVNALTHWQPGTVLLTFVSLLAFLLSADSKKVRWTVAHIVLVQWVPCALLYVFESRR